jgi:hypothetical protein
VVVNDQHAEVGSGGKRCAIRIEGPARIERLRLTMKDLAAATTEDPAYRGSYVLQMKGGNPIKLAVTRQCFRTGAAEPAPPMPVNKH